MAYTHGTDWDAIRSECFKLPPKHAANVIKTWLNAWCTSERCHESHQVSCVFGCDQRDRSAHYIVCPELRRALSFASLGALGASPLQFAALADATRTSLRLVSIAFNIYHTLRFEHAPLIALARLSLDFTAVNECACRLAVAFGRALLVAHPVAGLHNQPAFNPVTVVSAVRARGPIPGPLPASMVMRM
jgi:hypothetical protein